MEEFLIEEFPTSTGDLTIRMNGYFLHSKYNPKKEAKQFVEKNYKPDSIIILFGYGKGYILDELIEISDDEKIILIEPFFDITSITNERVKIINEVKSTNLENLIAQYIGISNNCNLITSPNYDKIFRNEYLMVLKTLKNILFINKVYENTLIESSADWHKNYIFNLKYLISDKSLNNIRNYTNMPVVVASGGPSLTKQLKLLEKYRSKIILIAAGSTIRSLKKVNIEPDYVVSIDGSVENYDHFKKINLKNTKFIYGMQSYYKIRSEFKGEAYYFLQAYSQRLKPHIEKITNEDIPVLLGGGSVAHFALSIATFISNGEIALIGQDLAFTDGHSHADGNKGNKKVDIDSPNSNYIEVEGYFGDVVYTDYPFFSMKKTFEDMRKQLHARKNIFNCTEGGVKLKGYEQIPFVKFLLKISEEQFETSILNESQSIEDDKKAQLLKSLKQEIIELDLIEKIIKKNINIIRKVEKQTSFLPKDLKLLDKNDGKIKKTFSDSTVQMLTAPIDIQVQKYFSGENIKESSKEQFERILKQNYTLYNGYLWATKKGKENIEILINELENNNYE